jgi:hypothetical protein
LREKNIIEMELKIHGRRCNGSSGETIIQKLFCAPSATLQTEEKHAKFITVLFVKIYPDSVSEIAGYYNLQNHKKCNIFLQTIVKPTSNNKMKIYSPLNIYSVPP